MNDCESSESSESSCCYLLHSEKFKNKIAICGLKLLLFALNVTERLPELTGTTADVLHLGKWRRWWLV